MAISFEYQVVEVVRAVRSEARTLGSLDFGSQLNAQRADGWELVFTGLRSTLLSSDLHNHSRTVGITYGLRRPMAADEGRAQKRPTFPLLRLRTRPFPR